MILDRVRQRQRARALGRYGLQALFERTLIMANLLQLFGRMLIATRGLIPLHQDRSDRPVGRLP